MKENTTSKQADSVFASRQNDSKKTMSQQAVFEDNRPETAEQKDLHQMIDGSSHMAVQRKQANQSIPQKTNQTGLPDQLKTGIENLSGYSMDNVKVHYNSDKPAQLQAHAYAQGSNIHLARGQEKHLPHEAWHVVQQKQGRVQPTIQLQSKNAHSPRLEVLPVNRNLEIGLSGFIGVNINDDAGLEKEADVMGTKALQMQLPGSNESLKTVEVSNASAQLMVWTSNGNSWEPAHREGVNYGLKPREKRPAGTTYNDETRAYTYPVAAAAVADFEDTPAGQLKKARIQPYLNLFGHLEGELGGNAAKGGHLLTAMREKWGARLVIENPEKENPHEKWHTQWSIDGKKKNGGSTMFPSTWTKARLKAELLGASYVGGKVELMSGMLLKKTSDTFYPA